MNKKLLINWLYKNPVGHVVEGLKIAKGYALKNPDLDVYLIVNADSPVELGDGCPWVKQIYPISVKDVIEKGKDSKYLREIPKNWDYIITDKRNEIDFKRDDLNEINQVHNILNDELTVNVAKGYIDHTDSRNYNVLPRVPNPKINIDIPESAKDFVSKYEHNGPSVCIMLAGSKGLRQSPSVEKWLEICLALEKVIPNIKFYFTGVTKSEDSRTVTKDFTLDDINYLVKHLKNAESAYNIGLWNQIALMKKCDVFLSPHTGFAFLSFLVDTPWLEIATCRWPLYLLNDIPFYSVLPKCDSYPSLDDRSKECDRILREGERVACVADDLIEDKIPEIVEGIKLLLDKDFTYEKSVQLHLDKIKRDYDINRFSFFGGTENIIHS